MKKDELQTSVVMDRFAGGLLNYIDTYFLSLNGTIYRPIIDYSNPEADDIAKNWETILDQLQSLRPVRDYSPELKAVAKQYMPTFLKEYPEYEAEECLKL